MLRTVELTPSIVQRLKSGEKAKPLAVKLGLSAWKVYRIAHRHNIKLKRGRPVRTMSLGVRRQRFDEKHRPGAWVEFFQDASRLSLAQMAEKWELGKRKRQNAYQILRDLGYEGRKPTVVPEPLPLRPDVTTEKIRKLAPRCRSQKELAARLQCCEDTIKRRIRGTRITLPNGNRQRPDITAKRLTELAKAKPSVSAMAEVLNCNFRTVSRRAERFGIPLRKKPGRKSAIA